MHRKVGKCSECPEDSKNVILARVHPPQCLFHYQKQKSIEYNERAKAKQKSDPKKKKAWSYKREPTGELDLFRRIWDGEIPHADVRDVGTHIQRVSCVTGMVLPEPMRVWFMSHILKKSKFEAGRLDPENIRLMTFEEHETWEYKQYKIKDDPKWKHVFELKERLLEKYKDYET